VKTIRVLLVDDHALFRSGVAGLLREQPDFELAGEARDGREALERANDLMPDVILMDVYMPEVGGLEATRKIKDSLPYVKIVMLTVSEEEGDLFEAIKAGAHGYLLKNIEPKELLRSLRDVFQGEAPISKRAATKLLDEFARLSRGDSRKEQDNLSPREREVLEHLTTGATNKEIASSLCISENTVKNHLKNILAKLHLQNRVQAAAYALRKGLTQDRKSANSG